MEHMLDCTTQQGVDRDFEGDLASFELPQDPADLRRKQALQRLRARAAAGDEVLSDLLVAAGLA